jgi:hypothetical protein
MIDDENCQRCGWPYGKTSESGCTHGHCACTCAQYPACKCGVFDKEKPEVAISVPKGTVMPVKMPFVMQEKDYQRMDNPTLVILHQPEGKRAAVIYIGNDKGKAFDALIAMKENGDALLSEIMVEMEKV